MIRTSLMLAALCGLFLVGTAVAGEVGSVKGRFVLDGDKPELSPQPLIKKGDASVKDAVACAAVDVPNQAIVIGEDGGIANLFVYLKDTPDELPEEAGEVPSEPLLFDQQNCIFLPHAVAVRAGRPIELKNSDPVAHNVRVNFFANSGINPIIPGNGSQEVTFDVGESSPTPVSCDIHPHMRASLLVCDHPYFAVTGEDGSFEIKNLPAGKHTFRVWHEQGGLVERSMKVEIEAGETTDLGDVEVKGRDLE